MCYIVAILKDTNKHIAVQMLEYDRDKIFGIVNLGRSVLDQGIKISIVTDLFAENKVQVYDMAADIDIFIKKVKTEAKKREPL